MINTIIFDLDGTLLSMDFDKFTKIYFKELGIYFADLSEPKKLISDVLEATNAMVQSLDIKTNEQVFMEKFGQLIDGDLTEYQKRFDSFYDTGFLKAQSAVSAIPEMAKIIQLLKEKNYTLVLATNPLFPKKAITHRINWAGFDSNEFSYITSFEINHFCKPQIEFYEEVLNHIGKTADQCLMIGNDVQEDGAAEKIGIKTFIVTDNIINRNEDKKINCHYHGSYKDLLEFITHLSFLEEV